ncbi:MarR family transcriptional regulator [Streptomyces sp. IB2014 016-6]|uniref:GbsR/MarR family transcriptional regulator n=1 Tax=Streptomyces sp. IB2014 016-6 TaxID=2517818 RepID=UPI0011CCC740|nr:MarR family transcriptional regulator [Streptomyces sp. IB2014 016-6]TXL91907.1 MarR family transcriptional regulator [Streptomyces sp. IB2014 016-6]
MGERRREEGRAGDHDHGAGEATRAGEAHGSAEEDEAAVSQFVERFAAQLVEAGMTRMPARVFAALLSSERGVLSSAELGEQLKVSPAAVSGAIRYLAQVNMVIREREPGSRRERYRVQGNQWYQTLTNRDSMLRRWQSTLREGVDHFGIDTPQGQRINETMEFFIFLESELGSMMDRWTEHRAEQLGR